MIDKTKKINRQGHPDVVTKKKKYIYFYKRFFIFCTGLKPDRLEK